VGRYIGAGAVATGGILSMLHALPMILASVTGSLRDLRSARAGAAGDVPRVELDLPMAVVVFGSLGLVLAIAASHLIPTDLPGRLLGGAMIVLFGFLFVTVSSRITGVVGSSSNPISGMTIATLLLTCLIFVVLGWVGPEYRLTALSIAGVVCVASSNGGTTSQDLKTGFLVGATPWKQQVAILVGALTSAVFIGGTLLLLNWAYTTYTDDPAELPRRTTYTDDPAELPARKAPAAELRGTDVGPDGKTYSLWPASRVRPGTPGEFLVDQSGQSHWRRDPGIGGRMTRTASGTDIKKFNPPQPRIFATLIEGIMAQELPWGLVILGAVLAIVMQLAGVSALAFAVGVYLPLATTLPIFVGGVLRGLVDRARRFTPEEAETSPGTLMSTGLIAGGSLAGIIIALLKVFESLGNRLDFSWKDAQDVTHYHIQAIVAFALLGVILLVVGLLGKATVAEAPDQGEEARIGEIS
jgi:uncharacterized oligopeptide transporter (OPT) family protein